MKTQKIFIGYACVLFFLVSVVASCNGGDQRNKPYTPLYVYFNPLKLDMNMEKLMPYFVNYPNDWAKMGLRDYPMSMNFQYSYPAWGITGSSQYAFLANGRLVEQRRTSLNVGGEPDLMSSRMNMTAIQTLLKSTL